MKLSWASIGIAIAILAVLATPFVILHFLWDHEPYRAERITLVDYTVPFEGAREHVGAIWLLNHEKYPPPSGDAWQPLGSHVGYDPLDPQHPTRIADHDLSETDWLYVTDTYGVYEGDLTADRWQRSHLDYSRLVFGGITELDARAIADYTSRGGHIFLEFNALESPTAGRARAMMQELLGARWTGWTGRSFINLYDPTDVPSWLPELFAKQFGDNAELPRDPTTVLVHEDGRLILLTDDDFRAASPSIAVTARGREVIPLARTGMGMFYWFPILTADAGTEVLAELVLPATPGSDSALLANRIPRRLPFLTRRVEGGSHRVYLAGDLADVTFDAKWYSFKGIAAARRWQENNPSRSTSESAYWGFYVPAVRQLLREPFDGPPPAIATGR